MLTMHRSIGSPAHNATARINRSINQTPVFQRRRSNSTSNCVIEKKRGFRPSDRFDPVKREFLIKLGKKFWCRPPVRNPCPIKSLKCQPTLKSRCRKKKSASKSVALYKRSQKAVDILFIFSA